MSDHNTRNSVLGGMFWKFSERVLTQGTSFVVSLVLARLLAPEAHGLIALVQVFLNLSAVFITCGFATALIQKKDADDTDFSTIFFCSLFVHRQNNTYINSVFLQNFRKTSDNIS